MQLSKTRRYDFSQSSQGLSYSPSLDLRHWFSQIQSWQPLGRTMLYSLTSCLQPAFLTLVAASALIGCRIHSCFTLHFDWLEPSLIFFLLGRTRRGKIWVEVLYFLKGRDRISSNFVLPDGRGWMDSLRFTPFIAKASQVSHSIEDWHMIFFC